MINEESLNDLLTEISHKIDDDIGKTLSEYQMPPTVLATIFLARLYKMCEAFDKGQEYIKLMRKCADDTELSIHKGDESNVH